MLLLKFSGKFRKFSTTAKDFASLSGLVLTFNSKFSYKPPAFSGISETLADLPRFELFKMTLRWQASCFRFTALLLMVLASSSGRAEDGASVENGQRFVTVGQLAQVKSGVGRKSRFVLLDENGEVMSSLRPAAGVDLTEHIGEDVGVTARTLVDSDTPILLAESVTTFGAARQVSSGNFEQRVALANHEIELLSDTQVLPTPIPEAITNVPMVSEYPVTGAPIIPDSYASDGYVVGQGCGIAGCASCGGGCGNVSCRSCAACPCGLPGRYWIRAESMLWQTKGMDTPALLVWSPPGTSRRNAGVVGVPGNEILYGGEILDDSRSGGRFRIGKWCDSCNWVGFETDFLFLDDESQDFSLCSIGSHIIGRPFIDSSEGPSSELVNFPDVVVGTAQIDAKTSLWSINPRLRVNLSCERFPTCDPDPCAIGGYRFDVLVGYRYMKLDDDLAIREQLVSPSATSTGQIPLIPRFDDVTYFDIRDAFSSTNDFHGADIGLSWEGYRGPWSLELLGKVGIGNTRQKVDIRGSTTRTVAGNTFVDPGGLLALETNIGSHSRDKFTVLPEMNATLGYSITPRTRLLVGYTYIYWNNVVRAGEQIDTTVNTDLLPDPQPTDGPARPAFTFVDSGYWAQGLSLGLDYRW